ncbi:MAG: SDR family NAD(P)-dependent oxidoreductase [Candidatus Levyibacteriota bacterium]
MDIKDKVVIVTGASSGIGEATARLFAKKGAKVVLAARSREKLKSLEKELAGSLAVVCDMTNPLEIQEMVKNVQEAYGGIDILINNAGRGYDAAIEEIDRAKFTQLFDLNILGPLTAMQQVIPEMRNRGGGAIVNISSGTALMALPEMAAYSSLKRALVGLSLTARGEFASESINVSVVYPYITKTDFEKNTMREEEAEIWDGSGEPHPADSAEYVAEKILEAVETGAAEVYAHDWMKNP